jgi:hypothetical protein
VAAVVTETSLDPAPDPAECDVGEMVNVQPAWVTVNVWPAIVAVPTRWPPGLAAIATLVVPFPLPEAPEAIVRNEALLVAFHWHPAGAVTETLLDSAPTAAE